MFRTWGNKEGARDWRPRQKPGMRGRGPQRSPTKERITIRLSPEVVDAFRTSSPNWQGQIDDALKSWLRHHEPA
ncbi:BrnA antitoxin family protein [uncultured Castellaniella sp.]|uniref:BrnA antitoxin family protein n=1 Tax=uncultured Castellaniella sp. TaxID=647907 RepID=UPI00263987E0|nr:BrnA antitoxin family protein [uncultured Castellaniella sp.]